MPNEEKKAKTNIRERQSYIRGHEDNNERQIIIIIRS
jgi:hypothetical protein